MNKENKLINENPEQINLNYFNYLIANTKEIERYVEKFKGCLFDYYTLNISHFTNLSKLCNVFSGKMNQNFINTPIYQLKLIFQSIIEMQAKIYESMIPDFQIFILISESLIKLKKIIEEMYTKHNKLSNLGIGKEMYEVSATLMQYMNDLEKKTVEEFVWEKYRKHTLNSGNEKINILIDKIKNLEKTLFEYGNDKKSQYFSMIKESNDKIQLIYNGIKNDFQEYTSKLKDATKDFLKKIENFEKNVSSTSINLEIKNIENVFCSKSDFQFKEKDFNKYTIKILKDKKILLKEEKPKVQPKINKNDNPNQLKVTKEIKEKSINAENGNDDILYLTEEDIFEIISRLYNYDLYIVDKSKYDLEQEKGKLISLEISNKILLTYSEDTEKTKTKLIEEEKQVIEVINTKILNNIQNAESFFITLNNYRVSGKWNFNEKFYELLIYIYNTTQNLLMKDINYKLANMMIILSQTYYKEKEGKKIYILEGIKSHDLFKSDEFWKNIIIKKIEDELKSMRKFSISSVVNQDKKEDLVFTKLLAFYSLMKEFNFSQEKLNDISTQIFDKYKISQVTREQLLLYIK